ncbi:FAD-dependent oxidoreductase [Micromonospora aurantiaca]|uniref:oxidoreductase n=1 Tax=Micromonospora aurantiaca (nom. illeg.) TaxID=47850 RepID=UPI00381D3A92
MNTEEAAAVLSPLTVGPVVFKNRVVVTAHTYGLIDGTPVGDDAMHAYVRARLHGGAGALIIGETAIRKGAEHRSAWGAATSDDSIARLYDLLAPVQSETGGHILEQLYDSGGQVWHEEGRVAFAPSGIPHARSYVMPIGLGRGDIREIVGEFRLAARRVAGSGLTGVELKCDQGKLHHQFLSRRYNLRSDGYGGNLTRRLRLTIETLRSIREALPHGVVGVRLPALQPESEGAGLPVEFYEAEWSDLISSLSASGLVDYVSLSAATNSSAWGYWQGHPDESLPIATLAAQGSLVKSLSSVPVLIAGNILTMQDADAVVTSGSADLVGMTRAHIADPELVSRYARGIQHTTRPCISCNQGCVGNTWYGRPVRCTVNARSGREHLYLSPRPRAVVRRVLVIGGGPCGLEFARVAGTRGHQVSLVEKNPMLGGQMLAGSDLPFRRRFELGVSYLVDSVRRLRNVSVTTDIRFNETQLDEMEPDVVVVASGVNFRIPEALTDDARAMSHADALARDDWANQRVLVVDGERHLDALGIAEWILGRGASVPWVATPFDAPGLGMDPVTLTSRLSRLRNAGVDFLTWTEVLRSSAGDLALYDQVTNRLRVLDDIDRIVFVVNGLPDLGLVASVRQLSAQRGLTAPLVLGDALAPRGLEVAIREAYDAAVAVGREERGPR